MGVIERMLAFRKLLATEHRPPHLYVEAAESIRSVRMRVKRKGVTITCGLQFQTLLAAGKLITICPFSGIHLDWENVDGTIGPRFDSPSFDQIRPGGGYSADNLQIVSNAVNVFKSNIPKTDMHHVLKALDWLDSEAYYADHVPLCARLDRND